LLLSLEIRALLQGQGVKPALEAETARQPTDPGTQRQGGKASKINSRSESPPGLIAADKAGNAQQGRAGQEAEDGRARGPAPANGKVD